MAPMAADFPGGVQGQLDHLAALADRLASRVEVLEAREAITEVLYRYARAVDRCDLALLKSCYWPDASDVHWFFNGTGHEFAEWVVRLLSQIPNTQHSITNPLIDLDGTRAFVESQWYVIHRVPLADGRLVDQQIEGRFLDVFECRAGVWRIKHRQTVQEAAREHVTSYRGPVEVPPTHPRRGQRAPDDAVYRGFGLEHAQYESVPPADLWQLVRERHEAPPGDSG